MLRVLVADDDQGLRDSLADYLVGSNYQVDVAGGGAEALGFVLKHCYDLCLLDVDMPGASGLQVLQEVKKAHPAAIVIMLTAYSNVPDAVRAMKDGAFNYLSKPVSFESLSIMINRALEASAMVQQIAFSAPSMSSSKQSLAVEEGKDFLAKSDRMKQIFGVIERLAKVDTAVLIRGESGTGKELVAKALHFNSIRKDKKFVAVNCSAIPEALIESEFFGHEKGAFTGASERKLGKFQFAHGGTLFLDEVGDISPLMQVKLLRVLQEQKFSPVGSNREIEVDVRIVAATNRNLEQMMKDGEFREDLYYRLNVLPIFLPPLRDRSEDIEILAQRFVAQFNKKQGREISGLSPMAMQILKSWKWPGNIRELENVIERAFVMESQNEIGPSSLPPNVLNSKEARAVMARGLESFQNNENDKMARHAEQLKACASALIDVSEATPDPIKGPASLADAVEGEQGDVLWSQAPADYHEFKDSMEKQFILRALKASHGKINQTARDSGIPKKTLLRKITKYGIDAALIRDLDS